MDQISIVRSNLQKKMIRKRSIDEKFMDILLSGTSATLVIQNDSTRNIYVSWVGDSMFTICSSNNTPKTCKSKQCQKKCSHALPHRASRQKEKFRIFGNKGEIRITDDYYHRVFLRGRVYPGMKTTRSIGDLLAHQIGVTSEPDFIHYKISGDKYLIVGTDCLWESFTP